MHYLIMLINQDIDGKEYIQSTTPYESEQVAKTQWHLACSSYQLKETTLKCVGMVCDSNGVIRHRDVYVKPQPIVEEEVEEVTEV